MTIADSLLFQLGALKDLEGRQAAFQEILALYREAGDKSREAAAMAGVPLAGTDWIPGRNGD